MPGVIDSRRWLRQRIEHLETVLRTDPPPDQRHLIEAELGSKLGRNCAAGDGGGDRGPWGQEQATASRVRRATAIRRGPRLAGGRLLT